MLSEFANRNNGCFSLVRFLSFEVLEAADLSTSWKFLLASTATKWSSRLVVWFKHDLEMTKIEVIQVIMSMEL